MMIFLQIILLILRKIFILSPLKGIKNSFSWKINSMRLFKLFGLIIKFCNVFS
jgi:hypothetical protein